MAKRAVFPVSMDLTHALLQLPEDVEVLHTTIGNYGLTLDLVITAPDMADVDPGCTPPRAEATYVREHGVGQLASFDYPREQPAGGAQ